MLEERTEVLEGVFGVVHTHLDDSGLFVVAPGRFGFGVLAAPLTGLDSASAEKLNQLMNLDYPVGASMQIVSYSSPDIGSLLTSYRVMRLNCQEAVLRETTRQRVNFLREGTRTPVDAASGLLVHDAVVCITVTIPAGSGEQFDFARSAQATALRQAFEATLKTIGYRFERLTAKSYLRFMQTILNQGPNAQWRHADDVEVSDDQLLCHQILDPDTAIDVDAKGLWLGEYARVKVLSAKRLPERIGLNMALRYLGDHQSGSRGIRENAVITLNILFDDASDRRNKLEAEKIWAIRQASGPLSRYVPKYAQRKKSLEIATAAINNGDRVVRAYLGMALIAPDDASAQRAVSNAVSYWRELRFHMMEDRYMVLPLFCQLLPFASEPDIAPALMRYKTFPSSHLVPLMPTLGAWRGTGTPLLTPISRDGQAMAVSPYDSDSNYNVTITAESGSGKSFLVNEMVANLRATGGIVRMIDVGYSYINLCAELGGQFLDFGKAANICINPFPAVIHYDAEEAELLSILSIMAAPKSGLTEFQTAALGRVLREEYGRHRHLLTINHIAQRCATSEDIRIRDLAIQLSAFTSDGPYGRYFNGPSTLDLTNPLIVLELDGLKSQPTLQRIVLLILMYQINQQMFRGDIAVQKGLFLDEAWDLLGIPDVAAFSVNLYRRVRKANGFICTVTQSVSDYYLNEGTIAIVENSANKYVLKQPGEAIARIQKEGRLDLGEYGYNQLRSVHTIAGEYSEIFFITGRGRGIGRLVVSPFNRLLYSTHPKDKADIKRHRARGLSLVEAINAIIDERGLRKEAA